MANKGDWCQYYIQNQQEQLAKTLLSYPQVPPAIKNFLRNAQGSQYLSLPCTPITPEVTKIYTTPRDVDGKSLHSEVASQLGVPYLSKAKGLNHNNQLDFVHGLTYKSRLILACQFS